MKSLATALSSHLQQENTKLTTCWRVTRTDGLVQGFTSGDKQLVIGGVIYKASTGFSASAFAQDNSLAVRNLELNSALSDDSISETDLVGGRYDYARVDIFLVNWENPPTTLLVDPPNHILMISGFLGEVSLTDVRYSAEIRSFAQLLQQKIGTLTTQGCRAVFGDSECTKDLTTLTDNLTIIAVTNNRQFTVSSGRGDGFFELGEVTFTSGENNGSKSTVLSFIGNQFQLFEPMPYDIQVGTTIRAVAGCAKTVGACKSYSNILNYQGEPHLPGEDRFLGGFEG